MEHTERLATDDAIQSDALEILEVGVVDAGHHGVGELTPNGPHELMVPIETAGKHTGAWRGY